MSDYIYSLILLVIVLLAIEIRKSYHEVPLEELKYRAREGDKLAEKIYRAVAYEESLEILLWLVIALAASGSLILFNRVAPLWLDFIAIAVFIGVTFAWLPRTRTNIVSRKIAVYATPAVVAILNYLHPLFQKVYNQLRSKDLKGHTGLYSNEDLADLIEHQKKQPDSRICEKDLELITKAINLAGKTVADYAKPWSKIQLTKADDPIGPVLLDELHSSGQTFVPVVDSTDNNKIVGMLELSQVDISRAGRVSDQMTTNVHYLKEDDSLEDALEAMTHTGRPVFIVQDSQDRFLGMITIKEVLAELVKVEKTDRDYTQASHEPAESEEVEDQSQPELSES